MEAKGYNVEEKKLYKDDKSTIIMKKKEYNQYQKNKTYQGAINLIRYHISKRDSEVEYYPTY